MFVLQTTVDTLVQNARTETAEKYDKQIKSYETRIETLETRQARALETAKYNYDTKVARLDAEKRDTISYNDQKHKEAIAKINSDRYLEISTLEAKHAVELDRAKAKADAKEIELMAELRVANNNTEVARENAKLMIDTIQKDAEARIKTAEMAANAVLGNAQLEATQLVAAGKARGEEVAYQTAKEAQENITVVYDDLIELIMKKVNLTPVDLSEIKEIVLASTSNFPKSVSGDVKVTNSNARS